MDKKIGEAIGKSLVGVFKGTRDLAVGIVDVVNATTIKTLEGVKEIGTSVSSIISGAIKTAGEVGADLTTVAKTRSSVSSRAFMK